MYVIVEISDRVMFWTGRGWCDEYPGAEEFSSLKEARKALKEAGKGTMCIVENYGYENEKKVS